jgi:hypothetical protein
MEKKLWTVVQITKTADASRKHRFISFHFKLVLDFLNKICHGGIRHRHSQDVDFTALGM